MGSRQKQSAAMVVVFLIIMLFAFGGITLAAGGAGIFAGFFFIFFIIIVVIIAKAAMQGAPGVQRPLSQQTAFAPPLPPDTILVKCEYCGIIQPFSQKCLSCGAPLPKPTLS